MNKSNSILLIDPSFDPANAPKCSLLIKVGLDSFSYAIIDKETNVVNAVFDEQECENSIKKLAERLKNDNYLGLPFQEVKVALHTENRVSIPQEFFNEEALEIYTQFFSSPHTENLYTNKQTHFGFTNIFALPKFTDELLQDFKAKKFQNTAGLLSLAEKVTANTLILDFTVASFTALYLNNNQVIFQQSYEISGVEEFNYYLLLMVTQLAIPTGETAVQLCGIVHEGDEKYNCLQKYFNHISFTAIQGELDLQVLDDMPSHYYTTLLALDQCE